MSHYYYYYLWFSEIKICGVETCYRGIICSSKLVEISHLKSLEARHTVSLSLLFPSEKKKRGVRKNCIELSAFIGKSVGPLWLKISILVYTLHAKFRHVPSNHSVWTDRRKHCVVRLVLPPVWCYGIAFILSVRSNLAQPEFRFHEEGSQSNYRRLPDGLRRGVEKVVKGWFWRMVAGGMMIPI